MTKRKIIYVPALCLLMGILAVRVLSQPNGSNQRSGLPDMERLRTMTEAERRRYATRRRAQRRQELERGQKESTKKSKQKKLEAEQRQKEAQERLATVKRELLREKFALRATEEQWTIIKPKLERVRLLRNQARSTVGLFLVSSSVSGTGGTRGAIIPTMQWNPGWKNTPTAELTEAQKTANRLMSLVDKDNTTDEQFRRQMAALRQSRDRQKVLEEELAEAREKLRKELTTRQEAALVLMGWL